MLKKIAIRTWKYFRNKPIINVYNSSFDKRVLISYITHPFRNRQNVRHSNYQESHAIADIFHDMNYVIDVYHQDDQRNIDYSKYDIIFGVGEPLENSYYANLAQQPLRIYYGLGRQIIINNKASLKRVEDFYTKHNRYLLSSARIGKNAWQIQTTLPNAIITLGNKITANSYKEFYSGPIYKLPVTFVKAFDYKQIVRNKNFKEAKKHYLWIGGSGLIHKGLDLLIDIFSTKEYSDLHLHICGPIYKEQEFYEIYKKKIDVSNNIHIYGFVNITSDLFRKTLQNCGFVIFPTCSEGQPSSIITAMANGGLIPILTKEAAINLDRPSVTIKETSHNSIKSSIEESQTYNSSMLKKYSLKIGDETSNTHNIVSYSKIFKSHIKDIILKHHEAQT